VATRVTGSQEAIEDGVNGYLVAPGDPEALAGPSWSCTATRRRSGVWETRLAAP
jgi:hypothetical protein